MKKLYIFITLMLAAFVLNINAQDIWERVPGDVAGATATAFAFNKSDSNRIYAGFVGTFISGVWLSTNDGNSWTKKSPNRDILKLVTNTSGHIFVSTRTQGPTTDSVFRTTDLGVTWTTIHNGLPLPGELIIDLIVNPINGYLFVGTTDGVYRSVNNGDNWTQINNGLPTSQFGPLAVSPDGIVFACENFLEGAIYRSVNNGDSWTKVVNGLIEGIFVNPITISEDGKIYIYVTDGEDFKGVFKSVSNGNSWSKMSNGLPDGFIYSLTTNSLGHVFAGRESPNKVYRSINGGHSWHPMSEGLPTFGGPIYALASNYRGKLFAGNGGFWRTIDSTTSQTVRKSLKNLNQLFDHINPAVIDIHVSGPGTNIPKQNLAPLVESVDISIDEVLHTRTGDLTFTLEHNGVTITLISEAGGNGQDFISTLLSDDAEELIGNGTAPFTGFYKPEQPLSAFQGMDPFGDWTLTITDGYAGNDGILNGLTLQIMTDSPLSNIEVDTQINPSGYNLEQNYPNPFNPSTTISWQSPTSGHQTLKVYDLLGNEVATLVDEFLPTGTL